MAAVASPEETAVRAWFNEHGWKLDSRELRAALQERGADDDLTIELLDEGADRRRAQPQPRKETRQQPPPSSPDERVPPQNLDAEENVLGAMLVSPAAIGMVRDTGLEAGEFYRHGHGHIYQAILALTDTGQQADAIAVADHLDKQHQLDKTGGRVRLHELANIVPYTANAAHWARIVREMAALRQVIEIGQRISEVGWTRPGELDEIVTQVHDLAASVTSVHQPALAPEAVDAGTFVFDEPDTLDQIRLWGDDTQIGWAAGEGLMLLGPDGVGKTTLGQQLALARCGLQAQVLGMPITPDPRRVLYIAADRPRQAARSLRRMTTETQRQDLAERMHVWRGPLPRMLNEDRTILAKLARDYGAGTIIIDSLKDVAIDIAKDDAGGRIAAAFQHVIAAEIELLVLHHPRKPEVGQNRPVRELADAYGSRLIYGVMGSVIILWGNPGDSIIELRHLKQPIEEIGPWNIRHDHAHGHTTIEHGTDLLDIVLAAGSSGVTATDAASAVYSKEAPTKNEVDRVRKRLDRLAQTDKLVKFPGRAGGRGGGADQSLFVYNGPHAALT